MKTFDLKTFFSVEVSKEQEEVSQGKNSSIFIKNTFSDLLFTI